MLPRGVINDDRWLRDILREIDFAAIINDFAVAKSREVSGLWI